MSYVEISVAIDDEDLQHVGLDPKKVNKENVKHSFEAILQEEYFFDILRRALEETGDLVHA